MSDKTKRILIKTGIILGIIAVIVIFFAWPEKDSSEIHTVTYEEDSEKITRYEFAELLCERYGLISEIEYEQFYEDVSSDNEYYEYVELAYAAGLLPDSKKFDGEKKVTAEYAATASMKILYSAQIKQIVDETDKLDDDDYYDAAKEKDLVSRKSKKLTRGECKELIENVKKLFTETSSIEENYIDIDYAKNVVEIPDETVLGTDADFTKVYLSVSPETLPEVGTTITCTEPIFGKTIIGEVVKTSVEGGVCGVEIKQPDDISKVVESADIQVEQTVDILYLYKYFKSQGMIEEEEGFDNPDITASLYTNYRGEAIPVKSSAEQNDNADPLVMKNEMVQPVSTLVYSKNNDSNAIMTAESFKPTKAPKKSKGFSITIKIDDEGRPSYTFSSNDLGSSFTLMNSDAFLDKMFKTKNYNSKVEGLSDTQISLDMSNMEFGALYSYEGGENILDPDEMYIYSQYDVSVSGGINPSEDWGTEGNDEEFTGIPICEFPVQAGPVLIKGTISLQLGIEGKVEVTFSVPNQQVGMAYKRGGVMTNISSCGDMSRATMDLSAELEAQVGPQLELYAYVFDIIPTADVEGFVGVGARAQYETHSDVSPKLECIDLSVGGPLFTIKICGDDDNPWNVARLLIKGGKVGYALFVNHNWDPTIEGKIEFKIIKMDDVPLKLEKHYESKGFDFSRVKKCTYNQSKFEKVIDKVDEIRQIPRRLIKSFKDAKKKVTSLTTTTAYRLEDWTTVQYDQYDDGSIEVSPHFNWLGFMVHYITVRNIETEDIENDDDATIEELFELCMVTIDICDSLETEYEEPVKIDDTVIVCLDGGDANVTEINEAIKDNYSSLELAFESVSFESKVRLE